MQCSPPAWLSQDALSALRRRIRAPLFQLISYAEIIGDESTTKESPRVAEIVAAIIAASDSVLQIAKNLHAGQLGQRSLGERARDELLAKAQQLAALAHDLHIVASESTNAWRDDAEKLVAASIAFRTVMGEIASEMDSGMKGKGGGSSPAAESQPGLSGQSSLSCELITGGIVLVVDDDKGNRDVLSRRLLRDGCEVMLAETGRQALRMARRYDFDLVLLDVMMPDMDGISVLTAMKADAALRRLPVVMISAVDEIDTVIRSLELGADDFLPKPFNRVILRARINALMERKRLQDEEAKKTKALEEALHQVEQQRQRNEELLLNILPGAVARELQERGSVQPMYFEDVTIAFADFVGFTAATEQLPADELVRILNEYFTSFDQIMKRYGLEKLKTIGDSYMFAGGLPLRSPSHPVDAILAALEMIAVTEQMSEANVAGWQLRVGIHTGPVVAGVVGIHKFSFDIWGDAVNFSSRLEASGAPGRVNISSSTYARIKDFFSCESRGKVRIKEGKDVEMYFVKEIAPRISSSAPRERLKCFEERYRVYFRKELQAFPQELMERQQP